MKVELTKIHSGYFLYTIPFIFRNSLLFISEFKSGPLKTIVGEEFEHIKFVAVKDGNKVRKNHKEYSHYSFKHFMMDTTKKMYQKRESCVFDVYASNYNELDFEFVFQIAYDYENHSYKVNNLTTEKLSMFNLGKFEEEIITNSQKIYHQWVYKRPRTLFPEKERLLKKHSFIQSIVFDRNFTRAECIESVNDIDVALDKIGEVLDFDSFPSLHLHFRDSSHHLGNYSHWDRKISLKYSLRYKKIKYKETFYHELYHYLYNNILKYKKGENERHNIFNTKLYDLLKESDTITQYRENSKDKKKNRKFYNYYLKREEVIARFFEAYFTYTLFPEVPNRYDYEVSEVLKYEHALLDYLIPIIKNEKTSLAI